MRQPIPGLRRPYPHHQLIHDAAIGVPAARERLITDFWPHMASIARHYQGVRAVDRDELMQEAVAGLLTALKRYDPELGTPFWAYAYWWVRQAMQDLVAQLSGPTVLSDRAARGLARLRHARRDHLQTCGREPSTAELAQLTGLGREHIQQLLSTARTTRSLQEPLDASDPAGSALADRLQDPAGQDPYERLLDSLRIHEIGPLVNRLASRESRILRARYGLGQPTQTLKDLGDQLGVSAERVRQIEARALEELREHVSRRADEDRGLAPQLHDARTA